MACYGYLCCVATHLMASIREVPGFCRLWCRLFVVTLLLIFLSFLLAFTGNTGISQGSKISNTLDHEWPHPTSCSADYFPAKDITHRSSDPDLLPPCYFRSNLALFMIHGQSHLYSKVGPRRCPHLG